MSVEEPGCVYLMRLRGEGSCKSKALGRATEKLFEVAKSSDIVFCFCSVDAKARWVSLGRLLLRGEEGMHALS